MSVPPASRIAEMTFLDAAPGVVFDDEAGAGGDVGLEVGIYPARVARGDLDSCVV